jgi:phage-related protein
MKVVQDRGTDAARHVRGPIWEVRTRGEHGSYRVLFAEEGARGRVLLALAGFTKQSQKTPQKSMELAKQRLSDWRRRSAPRNPPERSRSAGR